MKMTIPEARYLIDYNGRILRRIITASDHHHERGKSEIFLLEDGRMVEFTREFKSQAMDKKSDKLKVMRRYVRSFDRKIPLPTSFYRERGISDFEARGILLAFSYKIKLV